MNAQITRFYSNWQATVDGKTYLFATRREAEAYARTQSADLGVLLPICFGQHGITFQNCLAEARTFDLDEDDFTWTERRLGMLGTQKCVLASFI